MALSMPFSTARAGTSLNSVNQPQVANKLTNFRNNTSHFLRLKSNYLSTRSIASSHLVRCAEGDTDTSVAASQSVKDETESTVPVPVVSIDQQSDSTATIVDIEFGDRLGALLDTARALQELGLNVLKAKVTTEGSIGKNRFYITRPDTGDKVRSPEMLEAIRGTIIYNLMKYHPESSAKLAMGPHVASPPPKASQIQENSDALDDSLAQLRPTNDALDAVTEVRVEDDLDSASDGVKPRRSRLTVVTADHPGLLLEIVKALKDLSVNVESAEIETVGRVARDTFYVTYNGSALEWSMKVVCENCLRFALTRPEIESEDSY